MSSSKTAGEPVHVENESHLEELVADNGVVLIDFYADWCGPCKMLDPTLEEIAADTDAVVAKVDIEELQEFAQAEGVRSVPTLKFYADGEEAKTVIGVQNKSDLVDIIEQLG